MGVKPEEGRHDWAIARWMTGPINIFGELQNEMPDDD